MLPPEPEPLPRSGLKPLIAVIDSCIFPRRNWLDPILRSARAGYVVPIWTPLIISEVNRFLTWQWLARHSGEQTAASWAACSADSKRWFTLMTAVFRVVEDCPPHEAAWDSPRDEWDVPIWTAAKRCGAQFIVTANLKDGPPEDEKGRRVFEGVIWGHPDIFSHALDLWADLSATGEHAPAGNPWAGTDVANPTGNAATKLPAEIPQPFLDFLEELSDADSRCW